MQIAIEPLEAGIDIRRQRNQQQLDVDLIETEVASQAAQPQVGSLLFGGVGSGFDFLTGFRRRRIGRSGCCPVSQQAIDVRRRDVKTSKPIVGFRVGRAASGDGSPDPCLDQFEPLQHVFQ